MGYTQKILGTARSSLAAQQAAIGVTGNNIANVNTQGYSRRRAEMSAIVSSGGEAGAQVGSGVRFERARPIVDDYIQRALAVANGELEAATLQDSYLTRVEGLFSITGDTPTVGSSLTKFFSAINDLVAKPTSYELRFNLLERANTLTETLNSTMKSLGDLQSEADQRLNDEVAVVNELTEQIAGLNATIVGRERGGGSIAADERDQREILLQKLAGKIEYSRTENTDGSILLSLSNGFPIVVGANARALELTTTPSFGSPAQATSLNGGILSYVVYDYDSGAGTSHVDFTQSLQAGGGTIGGLLRVRGYASTSSNAFQANGEIVAAAQRVESIARDLLTTFNTEYLGPDENSGVAGVQYSSLDLNGATPTEPFAFFTFPSSVSRDAVVDGLPATNDLTALGNTSYARIIQTAITDPAKIAAARDTNVANGVIGFQEGNSANLTALYAMRETARTFTAGNFTRTTTYSENYNELLAYVGNKRSTSRVELAVAEGNVQTATARREELSGVSLDEEFSQLILFQKAYEASARMIKVAQELLDQVVSLI